MKKIIYILLFSFSFSFAQTPLTKYEKLDLLKKVTKEHLQEWANNKKEVIDLRILIKQKEKTIDSLGLVIVNERLRFRSDLRLIATNNTKINTTIKEIDVINEKQIKFWRRKFNWSRFHLSAGFDTPLILETQSLKWNESILVIGLNYEIGKFNLGIQQNFKAIIYNEKPILSADYYLEVRYNIF